MFARFQKYVYICTKNVTPRRRYSAVKCRKRQCKA
jgi:hypothetical protein